MSKELEAIKEMMDDPKLSLEQRVELLTQGMIAAMLMIEKLTGVMEKMAGTADKEIWKFR